MQSGTDAPSVSDGFVRTVSPLLGGPIGRHAAEGRSWWNPGRVALLVALLVYLLGFLQKLPCRVAGVDQFKWMCYTDIPLLYVGRGLAQGNTPYLDTGNYPVLEYPVLTGYFLEFERLITVALGAPTGIGLSEASQNAAALTFFYVNAVLLAALLLITVWAQVRTVPHRPWDAMMLAASPCVAATALINWDLLPVALTALGCMFWARRQPAAAGILLGLGMAAKLYPALLLGPLLLLCLRSRRMTAFASLLGAFVITWGVTNLPVLLLAPREWMSFWTFNSDRSGDLGSIWYVLSLAGHQVPQLNLVNALILIGGCLAIGLLIMFAPRRPRFGPVAFLVVAVFLMTNKVYSPQYVLWLLPLLILARPKWREWLIFSAGELIYFGAIWWHLGGQLTPGDSGPDKLYWFSVLVRLATQGWVAAIVVRDILRPEHDIVRAPGIDDPTGGVLDRTEDAAWLLRLRARVTV
ncbi:glycosyltransferase 87 family protein [Microlunatus panaciterrae]|uniref:Membrane protein n=1 Tax=Microlunatus panaciterrae TaxID=400768 RepID=A0ABS2RJU9_9ACTN|nr:glycosyltransferase 87 family protein [Microlunatus panaciterrae]MBM7798998.1 putative membrane protein [Microlunatus panaciterrae]